MAVTVIQTTSFKTELLQGVHVFTGGTPDTFKILLVKVSPAGTYDATLANVGTPGTGTPSSTNVGTDETTGTGYTSGGVAMAGATLSSTGTTAFLDWTTDPSWATSTISATKAIIYNSTKGNKTVLIVDFGQTVTDTNGTFTIQLPTPDATNAIIRLA